MTQKERLEFCTICINKRVDFKRGLVCSLSSAKPEFEDNCESFKKDEKEAERKLKQQLDAAGNARSQNGSLNPNKNIAYGIFLTISGVFILLISLLFGVILLVTGISFIIRGFKQKEILEKNKKFNEKLNR